MGCLFRCFRTVGSDEPRRNHLAPRSIPSTTEGSSVSNRPLGSFFLNHDHASPPKQVASPTVKDIVENDNLYGELKHEAEFLKACGALLQTPAEIRKASGSVTAQAPAKDVESSNHISRLPGTSRKRLLWDEKHELSKCPVGVQENVGTLQSNYESCTFDGCQTPQCCECSSPSVNLCKLRGSDGVQSGSAVEPKMDDICTFDGCQTPQICKYSSPSVNSSELVGSEGSMHNESSVEPKLDSHTSAKCSPFPTPVKVTDDMETPSTVYPTYLESVRTGNYTRIRTQYVYPVLNPLENLSRWKLLNEDSPEPVQSYDSFDQKTNYIPDAEERIPQVSLMSERENTELSGIPRITSPCDKRRQKHEIVYTDKYVSGKSPNRLETPSRSREKTQLKPEHREQALISLSQWLKPPSAKYGVHDEIKEKSHSGKSSDADRPILGMVAAHWKDEEPEHRSPKPWDGNGIPNSTNKYKEDQKVSWHATPFEERLEKALSDENFLPQRKFLSGQPVEFEDGELNDTAAS